MHLRPRCTCRAWVKVGCTQLDVALCYLRGAVRPLDLIYRASPLELRVEGVVVCGRYTTSTATLSTEVNENLSILYTRRFGPHHADFTDATRAVAQMVSQLLRPVGSSELDVAVVNVGYVIVPYRALDEARDGANLRIVVCHADFLRLPALWDEHFAVANSGLTCGARHRNG